MPFCRFQCAKGFVSYEGRVESHEWSDRDRGAALLIPGPFP